ncbi:MOSC N-terminal beta barrel domain-containing protein [Thermoleptolyngbya sp. C42_A2020_037]|uniref:MOSC domain-containing protein n=1 Tax=Thermoleptolyngbya sp. C42_A2020_037 TaxID=2747799 RepID=UPI001A0E76BF|nr:MOSC N-terminal beta barrel domain-containing protein [Thermoleptolyngbya sp. C42_A2020_037]MBF2084089.1 MOSC N-terminal beta barrel domain-containing protein [Thermoleptolyngbya sp. C42_A2020_037]
MTAVPHVSQIFIYPIKSLDGVGIQSVDVLSSGALKGDRQFALFDQAGQFVNGKRYAKIHALRAEFDLAANTVSFRISDAASNRKITPSTFPLEPEQENLEAWLSEYFGFPVYLRQNLEMGFPDDTQSPGPTIVSLSTLEAIATWYPHLTVDEVRARFRTNIEIASVPPFWEDRLFAQADQAVEFQIGSVRLLGVNPCQRCVVPTRNSKTGVADPGFQKTFVAKRQETLPDWAERSRFNHFYRLTVNTRLAEPAVGGALSTGDPVLLE